MPLLHYESTWSMAQDMATDHRPARGQQQDPDPQQNHENTGQVTESKYI